MTNDTLTNKNTMEAVLKRSYPGMRWSRRAISLIVLGICALCINTAFAEFNAQEVTAVEAAEILKQNPDIRILDVRTGFEYRRGHLKGSINLNYYSLSFEDHLAQLDKDITWLVHCRTGVRSSKTIPLMKEAGFTNVIDVSDGIVGWQNAGLPLVK